MSRHWKRLWRTAMGAYEHGALAYAKGAAYSALLAFFPVLTTTIALLLHLNASALSFKILGALYKVAPPGVENLVHQIMQKGTRPLVLPIAAILLALWAASGVTTSLMEGFQACYEVKSRRDMVHNRAIALWLVVVSIGPVLGASTLILFGDRAEGQVLHFLGLAQAGETLTGGVRLFSMVARYCLAIGTMVSVTALLYYFGPDAGRRRSIWPGALLASWLWLAITLAFAWYVRNIARYNVLYGSIGAVIALCIWLYLLALSAEIGCEYNAQTDRTSHR